MAKETPPVTLESLAARCDRLEARQEGIAKTIAGLVRLLRTQLGEKAQAKLEKLGADE